MLDNIREDIVRKREGFHQDVGWAIRDLRVLFEPGTVAVIVYRFGHWVRHFPIPGVRQLLLIPYALAKLAVIICTQIYISSKAKIGKGFVIHNFSCIFITDATIGENCVIYQGVTIGHLRHYRGRGKRKKRPAPRLGNNVFLASGCKVLGDVVIGDNVVVGANTLVVTSVPDQCTVLGVPGKIVSRNTTWTKEKLEMAEANRGNGSGVITTQTAPKVKS